mgnify:CR=1 FL=1
MGWCYLAFNVYIEVNVTAFDGYYTCDDVTLLDDAYFNSTTIVVEKSIYQWQDSNLNILSVGGMC